MKNGDSIRGGDEQYIGHTAPLVSCGQCIVKEDDYPCDSCEKRELYIGDYIMIWIKADEWNRKFGIKQDGYQVAEIVPLRDELGYRLKFPRFIKRQILLGREVEMECMIHCFTLEDSDFYYAGNIHLNPELLNG